MDWRDIGKSIANVAPTIAGTLVSLAPIPGAGVAAPLVSAAVRALEQALGLSVTGNSSPDDINAALSGASPETLLALKKADQQFIIDCKRADIDLEAVLQKDRASARDREIAVKDSTPRLLATLIISAFCVTVGAIVGFALADALHLDPTAASLVGGVVGYLSAKGDTVIAYYFGSSSGSAQKTNALADIANKSLTQGKGS